MMRKLVRCKACGYIMPEDELRDRCPACGALKAVFEPYTDLMGRKRRRILNLDLHAVAVHFPITFAVAIFVFSIAIVFIPGQVRQLLVSTASIMTLLLPLLVLIALLVGLLDGRLRFRHVKNSQILKNKIAVAIIFFILAVALPVIVWLKGFAEPSVSLAVIILAAVCVACSFILGLLGKRIRNSAFPGE
jgi:uncharacterized membrane protein